MSGRTDLLRLCFPGRPVLLSWLSWLSCHSSQVPVVLSPLTCPCYHVLIILSRLTSQADMSRLISFVCPVLAVLLCLSCPADLSWHGRPAHLSFHSCLVLADMFWLSCPPCPVLAELFWLSCLSLLSCSSCPFKALFLVECSDHTVWSAISVLPCTYCPVLWVKGCERASGLIRYQNRLNVDIWSNQILDYQTFNWNKMPNFGYQISLYSYFHVSVPRWVKLL
jgi:hypothetical protein